MTTVSSACTCLEVFGEDPDCPLHSYEALEARIADLEELIEAQHGDVVVRTAKLLYEKDDKIAALSAEAERLCQERDEARLNAAIIEGVSNELDTALSASNAEAERLREALTPSAETKAAYIGEFTIAVERRFNDDGEVDDDSEGSDPYDHIAVPWTTIKEIMAAIRARALQGSAKQ